VNAKISHDSISSKSLYPCERVCTRAHSSTHSHTCACTHVRQDELDPDSIDLRAPLRAPPPSMFVHAGAGDSASPAASQRGEELGIADIGSGGSVGMGAGEGGGGNSGVDGGGGGGGVVGEEREPCDVEEVRRKRLERFG
jgi:hypothetical protein